MDTYSKIKQLCDEKGIKISTLAQNTGIRSSVFSELKMGRTKKLSAVTLEKIANFFEVPVSALFDDETDGVNEIRDELFLKRKLLFDMSAKANEQELDRILKIVDALVNE